MYQSHMSCTHSDIFETCEYKDDNNCNDTTDDRIFSHKEHKCNKCDKSFEYKSVLLRHIDSHSEVRRYKCDE